MKKTNESDKTNYRIPLLEASMINIYNEAGFAICITKKEGNYQYAIKKYYHGEFKYCLETDFLIENASVLKAKDKDDKKADNYLCDIVSVAFNKAVHNYNCFGKYEGYEGDGLLYVKYGYIYDPKSKMIIRSNNGKNIFYPIDDNICVINEELIAIAVNTEPVKNNRLSKLSTPYFIFDDETKQYQYCKNKDKSKVELKNLRKELYDNGFTLLVKEKIITYKRYKRSVCMSREGNCYFIKDMRSGDKASLLNKMNKWGNLNNLNAREKNIKINKNNIVSNEAYTALSLSSLEDKFKFSLDSILFMNDAKSKFNAEAIIVKNTDKLGESITVATEEKEINNKIWDGESLLDEEVFKEVDREQKGMMLLRNKYFKSCAFNTSLQKWFKDNRITDVKQLNGFTLAKNINQIKMVVTSSSLKFMSIFETKKGFKGNPFEEKIRTWINWIDERSEKEIKSNESPYSYFGIVKSEKRTHYLDGDLVRTNYQFINTINLTQSNISTFLTPISTLNTMLKYHDDKKLYFYINNIYSNTIIQDETYPDEDNELTEELDYYNQSAFKKNLVSELLKNSDVFRKTRIFNEYRKEVVAEIVRAINMGRVLVHGTNATLFGNGYELLEATIFKKEDVKNYNHPLNGNEIYSPFFPDGAKLVCARSPHITMGNLITAINKYNNMFAYFNLTKEIVCVNAIENNIMEQLNGADYDSDTMLITDNETLVSSVPIGFKIPVNGIGKKACTKKSLYEIDHDISENRIGEIVNLSQILNSIYWTICNEYNNIPLLKKYCNVISEKENADVEKVKEMIYEDICTLAILSNTEIDKAKREYHVNVTSSLMTIREKYVDNYRKLFAVPSFWKNITKVNSDDSEINKPDICNCPLSLLYKNEIINSSSSSLSKKYHPLISIVDNYSENNSSRIRKKIEDAYTLANDAAKAIDDFHSIRKNSKSNSPDIIYSQNQLIENLKSCIVKINNKCTEFETVCGLLNLIGSEVSEKNKSTNTHWIILSGLCYNKANNDFSYSEENIFFKHLIKSESERFENNYNPEALRKEINKIFNIES